MTTPYSEQLLTKLARAEWVTAFTGAGISAESGVPTFRGAEGIWSKFKPEELATMAAFMRNPELVWEWYSHRRKIIADVKPNPGHEALVRMEKLYPRVAVITQNIDNLHRRAGSTTVHELHGNIERNYCMECGTRASPWVVPGPRGVPRCDRCGGMIRPDVVWFGESLPEEEWDAAVRATEASDIFLSIGTSGIVYPAASLPLVARRHGAYLVEINPEPTPLTEHVDEFLQGPSGQILPGLVAAVMATRNCATPTSPEKA